MDTIYRSNQIGQKFKPDRAGGIYYLHLLNIGYPKDGPMQQSQLMKITVVVERTSRTFFHRIDALGIHDIKPLENFCT